MTILTFPTLAVGPSGFGLQLIGKTSGLTSPLTKKTQSRDDGGYKWLAEVDYAVLSEPDWRLLHAFFAHTEGQYQRFYYTPPHVSSPQGAGGGTPIFGAANQTGTTIRTVGWPALTTVLKAGDCFCFDNVFGGREMKMVTSDVTSNAAGFAAISFEPRIRIPVADSTPITINNPSFVGRLLSLNMGDISIQPGRIGSCNFQVIEALVT